MFDTGEGEYVGPLAFPVRVGFGETLWTVGGTREYGTPKALIPLDVVGECGVGMDTRYRGTHLIGGATEQVRQVVGVSADGNGESCWPVDVLVDSCRGQQRPRRDPVAQRAPHEPGLDGFVGPDRYADGPPVDVIAAGNGAKQARMGPLFTLCGC
jgi:hypothetical protein